MPFPNRSQNLLPRSCPLPRSCRVPRSRPLPRSRLRLRLLLALRPFRGTPPGRSPPPLRSRPRLRSRPLLRSRPRPLRLLLALHRFRRTPPGRSLPLPRSRPRALRRFRRTRPGRSPRRCRAWGSRPCRLRLRRRRDSRQKSSWSRRPVSCRPRGDRSSRTPRLRTRPAAKGTTNLGLARWTWTWEMPPCQLEPGAASDVCSRRRSARWLRDRRWPGVSGQLAGAPFRTSRLASWRPEGRAATDREPVWQRSHLRSPARRSEGHPNLSAP